MVGTGDRSLEDMYGDAFEKVMVCGGGRGDSIRDSHFPSTQCVWVIRYDQYWHGDRRLKHKCGDAFGRA